MNSQRPVVRVLPRQGVGTLFSGTVRHAGHPVRSGVRYVLVAFCTIDPAFQGWAARFSDHVHEAIDPGEAADFSV